MPLTNHGFQRKTYDDILTEQSARARLLFGDDIDVSEQSVFGKMLRLYCLDAAENQETAEGVYLSMFPNSAQGASLDRICTMAGITRNQASYAQHTIKVSGTAGTAVTMGFLVSAGDVVFHSVDNYIVGSDGTVNIIVECNEAGIIGNVAVGAIDTIVNPILNITSITHTSITQTAVEKETDYSLRTRFTQALSGTASGTVDAIRGAVLRVNGVESCLIIENSTVETVDGLPAHSFICYVLAPEAAKDAIARAIFDKKPVGISSEGTEAVTVTDAGGGNHVIKFSWTQTVNIYVNCTIVKNSLYSTESAEKIKDNIVKKLSAYTNGQNVTATSLYSAIYVDGVDDVTSLKIGKSSTTIDTSTIIIANNQVARASTSNITIVEA